MKRVTDFRELKDSELETQLINTRDELFRLRFKHATGQLDNSARLGQVRKDIARIQTVLREREISAAESDDATPTPASTGKSASSKEAK